MHINIETHINIYKDGHVQNLDIYHSKRLGWHFHQAFVTKEMMLVLRTKMVRGDN